MAAKMRSWCARGQYQGKEPFLFGMAMLPIDARHDEVEAALRACWDRLFPIDPPPVFEPIAGMIWFQEEGE